MGDPKTCGESFVFDGIIICRSGCKICDPNNCDKERLDKALAEIMKNVKEDEDEDNETR